MVTQESHSCDLLAKAQHMSVPNCLCVGMRCGVYAAAHSSRRTPHRLSCSSFQQLWRGRRPRCLTGKYDSAAVITIATTRGAPWPFCMLASEREAGPRTGQHSRRAGSCRHGRAVPRGSEAGVNMGLPLLAAACRLTVHGERRALQLLVSCLQPRANLCNHFPTTT